MLGALVGEVDAITKGQPGRRAGRGVNQDSTSDSRHHDGELCIRLNLLKLLITLLLG
jgi:hypothetical protein